MPYRPGEPYPPAERYPPPAYPPDRYPRAAADPRGGYQRPGGYPAAARSRPRPRSAAAAGPDEPEDPAPPLATALTWTVGAFLVPLLLYIGWGLTRSDVARPGCVDANGQPCPPPQVAAFENLLAILPAVGGAFLLAVLIAVLLRWLAVTWRAGSVGLAAAVIGGAFATVVAAFVG